MLFEGETVATDDIVEYKRSRYFLVQYLDQKSFDLHTFLRGGFKPTYEICAMAVSALTELAHQLTRAELVLLARIPDRVWSTGECLASTLGTRLETLAGLAEKALLVSTSNKPEAKRLRAREEAFAAKQWHPLAACYNLMLKHPGGLDKNPTSDAGIESIAEQSPQILRDFVAKHGLPPAPFSTPRGREGTVELPRIEKQGGLYRALARRRTVRRFHPDKSMRVGEVSTLLDCVFGCQAYAEMSENVTLLRRTSPSGGSLHPIEVYPLVLKVDGLETGLYHYSSRDHTLSRMSQMELSQAKELAVQATAGQRYAADAHILLLLTARFYRNFWKYRNSVKTHGIILLDAGHLSQTFYLVCADLGLGASFIAINGSVIEETLALDGIEEGAIGLVTCGVPVDEGPDFGLNFLPYNPGETII